MKVFLKLKCFTSDDIKLIFNLNDVVSRDSFIQLCPALVYLKTSEACGSKLLSKTDSKVNLKVDTKSETESESSETSTVTDAESNIKIFYMYIY